MANRFIGDASFEVDGQTYKLRLDFNAMCELEDATDKDAMEIIEGYEKGKIRMKDLRALFWALLQHHHSGISMEEAGRLLSEAPDAVGEALAAAAPEPEKAAKSGNGKSRGKAA